MRPSLTLRLAALGGWPRRLAALACLLLAAATALQPGPAKSGASHAAPRIADGLAADEVAVPVPLADAGACTLLRAGDRIDLYPTQSSEAAASARAGPVGSHLRVLALVRCMLPGESIAPGGGATVVVAAGHADAVALTRLLPLPMVAVSLPSG